MFYCLMDARVCLHVGIDPRLGKTTRGIVGANDHPDTMYTFLRP